MRTSEASDFARTHPEGVPLHTKSFEEYQRLRVAALREIPISVADDILENEPQDSIRRVQAARERRLRQVIRRYENQIQYGCYNKSCTAPSCLSYRRRNSKTPLRPYTDTSARALACHLVEECSRSRKDPGSGLCQNQPVVPWHQDSRSNQARRYSGSQHQRKLHPASTSNGHIVVPTADRLEHASRTDASVPSQKRSSQPTVGEARSRTSTASSPDSGGKSLESTPVSHVQQVSELAHVGRGAPVPARIFNTANSASNLQLRRTHEDIIAHRVVDNRTKYLVIWRDGGRPKIAWSTEGTIQDQSMLSKYKNRYGPENALDHDQVLNLEAHLRGMDVERLPDQEDDVLDHYGSEKSDTNPAKKLDFASFAQTLWNTLTLRSLNAKETSADEQAKGHTQLPTLPNIDNDKDNRWAESTENTSYSNSQSADSPNLQNNTAFRGFTLRRLPWNSVLWLHDRFESHKSSAFETFIKQSVHYSLRNPVRLIESAQSWQHPEHEFEYDTSVPTSPDLDRTESKDETEEGESSRKRSDHPQNMALAYIADFNPNATIDVFEMISTMSGGSEFLFKTLHDTIQQCYNISHASYGGDDTVKAARKTFKALGGGLIDHTIKDNEQKRLLRRIGQFPDRKQISQIFALVMMALVMPLFNVRWTEMGLNPILFLSISSVRSENNASMNILYSNDRDEEDRDLVRCIIEVLDHLQGWHRQRLIAALTDCMSHHIAAMEISKHRSSSRYKPRNVVNDAIDLIAKALDDVEDLEPRDVKLRVMMGLGILELGRTVLLMEWDRKPIISRTGPVGGALELLSALHRRLGSFKVSEHMCAVHFVAQGFDELEMPVQWLSFEPNGRQTHILAYPFLFELATLVKYFRAINASAMRKSFEIASMVYGDASQFLHSGNIPVYNGEDVLSAMRPYMAKYFVLTIRRHNVLGDALSQLWRRQKREILRPLRVRLGRDEGEDGLDHGGVQQEFFRLAFAEAFDPNYGMFCTDDRTHMVWFQPGGLEPPWKYEALGILLSLAIYNAVTLPITMPLAFYRRVLGFKVNKLEHIKDGWPVLEKGLQQLLEYDGDVAEDIGRTYEFTYEFGGAVHSIDMSRHKTGSRRIRVSAKGKERARSPSFALLQPVSLRMGSPTVPLASPNTPSPTSDAVETDAVPSTPPSTVSSSPCLAASIAPAATEVPLVTNANRKAYVRDYIEHLTDKTIAPQFSAFLNGLHTCVSPRALSLFTPTQLRDLVEGHRAVDIDELQASATYEGFSADEEYIKGFWEIVREETRKDQGFAKALLEFVTASERVPVGGLRAGGFVVQRNGDFGINPGSYRHEHAPGSTDQPSVTDKGDRDEEGGWKVRLPSSSTCYGRLLLPRYEVYGESGKDLWREDPDPSNPVDLWKEVLRERLCKAVREGRGFGML